MNKIVENAVYRKTEYEERPEAYALAEKTFRRVEAKMNNIKKLKSWIVIQRKYLALEKFLEETKQWLGQKQKEQDKLKLYE